ncbi:MAG TPA: hypothetical protein VNS02_07380 [Rhizobiaceae bacterium]|nr:hypothetical protein [Rhizobiaceae bacterium]
MAMAPMKIIKERLAAKEEQARIIQAEIELLRSMLAEANGEPDPSSPRARAPRANVKNLVLKYLQEAGATGLTAPMIVNMALSAGFNLERPSVSSTLSRLKSDGVLVYDGDRYRVANSEPGWNVHPHPASKGVFG